jgi:hypothetical protein
MIFKLGSRVLNKHLDSYGQKKIIHYTNDPLCCIGFIDPLYLSFHATKRRVLFGQTGWDTTKDVSQ